LTIDRYEDFRAIAQNCDLDAVVLVPGPNFHRLFDKNFSTSERPLAVVIPKKGVPAAVVPNLEMDSFKLVNFEGAVFDWYDHVGYQGAFDQLATHMKLGRIGVEGQEMRVFVHHALQQAFPGLEIVDSEREISLLRICKSAPEIAAIEKAISITEEALSASISQLQAGLGEVEIEQIIIKALFDCGAEGFAFYPIVAAGDNSARPHAKARADYMIKAGDSLLIDIGVRWGSLCSDITRTFFLEQCSDEQSAAYETVKAANQAGHDATRPGATAHDVDDAVMKVLEAADFSGRLASKTGHGLGRAVHEAPYIVRGNPQVLEPGMVFTNEPGLYKAEAFGIRIEDDVLVTEDGKRILTTFSRELTIIG